jgi:MAP/microtubule affinity-regulating kinase
VLKKFLTRDPVKRNSLDILIDDIWINDTFTDSPITVDISETIEEDEAILNIMIAKYKIEKESILNVLREKVYNDISAIYYLMYYDKDTVGREGVSADPNADILKIANPSKKDSIISQQANGKLMPIIDEDGVDEHKPTQVYAQTATTSKPPAQLVTGHRKRAATATNNKKSDERIENGDSISPKIALEEIIRPVTAVPGSESSVVAHDAIPTQRKRNNTIIGILKGRKNSHSGSETGEYGEQVESDKPRSLRFTFNSKTTSTKQPDEIIVELIKCCNSLGCTHRLLTRYLLECNHLVPAKELIKIEIEVCKLPRLNNLHGLKFKRTSGSSADYKEVCEKLLGAIQL